MQTVILSAGLGTRLRPLTDNLPKVMVPVLDKPILQHHIERFKEHGVEEFLINLHYLPEKITGYFGGGRKFGVRITYSFERKILGTAGAIKKMEPHLANEFFVIYGDVFSLLDYTKLFQFYREKGRDCLGVAAIGKTDHPIDSDLVTVNQEGRFVKLFPKPHKTLPATYFAMRGTYVLSKEILRSIPENQYCEIDHELLPAIISKGLPFYGYVSDEYLKDIGTKERYEAAEKFLSSWGNQ